MKLSRNKIDKLLKNRNQSRKNKKAKSLYHFTKDELIIAGQAKQAHNNKQAQAPEEEQAQAPKQAQAPAHNNKPLHNKKELEHKKYNKRAKTMHAKPSHVNLRLKTLKNKRGGEEGEVMMMSGGGFDFKNMQITYSFGLPGEAPKRVTTIGSWKIISDGITKGQAETKDAMITRLQGEVKANEAKIKANETKIQSDNDKIIKNNTEISTLKQKIYVQGINETEKKRLETDLNTLQETNDHLMKEINTLILQNEHLTKSKPKFDNSMFESDEGWKAVPGTLSEQDEENNYVELGVNSTMFGKSTNVLSGKDVNVGPKNPLSDSTGFNTDDAQSLADKINNINNRPGDPDDDDLFAAPNEVNRAKFGGGCSPKYDPNIHVITYQNKIVPIIVDDAEKFFTKNVAPGTTKIHLMIRTKVYMFFYNILYGNLFFLLDVQYIRNFCSYLSIIPEYKDLVMPRARRSNSMKEMSAQEKQTEDILENPDWTIQAEEEVGEPEEEEAAAVVASTNERDDDDAFGSEGGGGLVVRKGEWSKARWLGKSKELAGKKDTKYVGFPHPIFDKPMEAKKIRDAAGKSYRKLDYTGISENGCTKFDFSTKINDEVTDASNNIFHYLMHAKVKNATSTTPADATTPIFNAVIYPIGDNGNVQLNNAKRTEALKLMLEFIDNIEQNTKDVPEFTVENLNIKYYFNFICYCFLPEIASDYVNYLEKISILKKINFFYQQMGLEDFKKSQEDKPTEGYLSKFFRKFRVLQLPGNVNTKTEDDFKIARRYIQKIVEAYASARIKLSAGDAEQQSLEGYLFTIGDTVGHGEFLKQYVKFIESQMSELRGKKLNDTSTHTSYSFSDYKNDEITKNLSTLADYYKSYFIMKKAIDVRKGMGESLVELYFNAQSTSGKDHDLKVLMAWLSNYDDIIGIVRDINASMTNTILPLAKDYGRNIIEKKKAEMNKEAATIAADLKKNLESIRDNLEEIREETMASGQFTMPTGEEEKKFIKEKIELVKKNISAVKPELTNQLKEKEKRTVIRAFLTKADSITSLQLNAPTGNGFNDTIITDLKTATDNLLEILYKSKDERDNQAKDKFNNEIMEITNTIYEKAQEIKELSAGDIVDIFADNTEPKKGGANDPLNETEINKDIDDISSNIQKLKYKIGITAAVAPVQPVVTGQGTVTGQLPAPAGQDNDQQKRFKVPEVINAIRKTELAVNSLDQIRSSGKVNDDTNPEAKTAAASDIKTKQQALDDKKADLAKKEKIYDLSKNIVEPPTDEKDKLENDIKALKAQLPALQGDIASSEAKIDTTKKTDKINEIEKLKSDLESNLKKDLEDLAAKNVTQTTTGSKGLNTTTSNQAIINASIAQLNNVNTAESKKLEDQLLALKSDSNPLTPTTNEIREKETANIAKYNSQKELIKEEIIKKEEELKAANAEYQEKLKAQLPLKEQQARDAFLKNEKEQVDKAQKELADVQTADAETAKMPNYLTGAQKLFENAKLLKDIIDKIAGVSSAAEKASAAAAAGINKGMLPGAAISSDEFAKLQRQVDELKAIVKLNKDKEEMDKEKDENLAAIQAIMTGEDAFSKKIKFLVDIPKWQQFKVIGSTDTGIEEFTRALATDIGRHDVAANIAEMSDIIKQRETEDDKIKKLTAELHELIQKYKAQETPENEQSLRQQVTRLKAELELSTKQTADTEKRIKALEENSKKVEDSANGPNNKGTSQPSVADLTKDLDVAKAALKTAQEVKPLVQANIDAAQKTVTELEAKIAATKQGGGRRLVQRGGTLKEELAQLEDKLNELNIAVPRDEAAIEAKKAEIEAKKAEIVKQVAPIVDTAAVTVDTAAPVADPSLQVDPAVKVDTTLTAVTAAAPLVAPLAQEVVGELTPEQVKAKLKALEKNESTEAAAAKEKLEEAQNVLPQADAAATPTPAGVPNATPTPAGDPNTNTTPVDTNASLVASNETNETTLVQNTTPVDTNATPLENTNASTEVNPNASTEVDPNAPVVVANKTLDPNTNTTPVVASEENKNETNQVAAAAGGSKKTKRKSKHKSKRRKNKSKKNKSKRRKH